MRRTPLKRSNPARRRRLHERNFGERAAIVRSMPCLLQGPGCRGQVQAAHVKSRGAGGCRRDMVPLCAGHHDEQGRRGIKTFSAEHRLDLYAEAARIATDLDARGVP